MVRAARGVRLAAGIISNYRQLSLHVGAGRVRWMRVRVAVQPLGVRWGVQWGVQEAAVVRGRLLSKRSKVFEAPILRATRGSLQLQRERPARGA